MALRDVKSDDGATAVWVAVMLVALLGMAAFAVDAGALYAQRRQMQTAADAAVLAGVMELPGSPDGAIAAAQQYVTLNTGAADNVTFEVASTWAANDTLVANVQDTDMQMLFARFLGIDTEPVGAHATAMIGSPRTYGHGLMPFGIVANGTTASPYGYAGGEVIPLVVDQGDQSQGNWHYVDLTPYTANANQTKAVIAAGGTTEPVSIGTIIDTQPGAPNNPNFKAMSNYLEGTCSPHGLEALVYDADRDVYEAKHASDGTPCNRLITCPIIVTTQGDPYNWDELAGSSVPVQIVGFVNMLVSNDPQASDGTLLATFVQVVPDDVLTPGAYVPYGGVMYWLED